MPPTLFRGVLIRPIRSFDSCCRPMLRRSLGEVHNPDRIARKETPSMALTQNSPVLPSVGVADKAIDAAIARVQEIGVPYSITVVDGAGLLVAARRVNGAAIASIDTSLAKARTAVYFAAATADLAPMVASGSPMMTVETAAAVPLAFVPGAVQPRSPRCRR
jgi:uncharacterized protein GlcG (DUF336 family)